MLRLETTPPGEDADAEADHRRLLPRDAERFAVLQPQLVDAIGSPASEAIVEEQEWATAIRAALESPEDRLYAGCGETADFRLATKSAYVRAQLPDAAIEATVAWLERRQREPSLNRPAPEFRPGVILLEPYGGAVGRVPREATAFVHRDERFLMLFEARWHLDHPEPARHEDWLHGWYEEMLPHCSGAAYQTTRPRAEELAGGLLRGQPRSPRAGEVALRPRRVLPFRAEPHSGSSVIAGRFLISASATTSPATVTMAASSRAPRTPSAKASRTASSMMAR